MEFARLAGPGGELMPPVERVVAARLGVFPGELTAESMAAVLELSRPVASRLLDALTERSLMTVSDGRYRVLEAIHTYSDERISTPEADDLHARHAAYLLELVRRAEPHLRGPDQLRWATSIRQESDNLRAAIEWATEHDQRLALELIAGLSTYWWMHGLRGEAGQAAQGLLAMLGPVVPDGLAEEYLLAVLHAAGSGHPDGIEQARVIVEELDEPFRHPVTVLLWSVVLGPFVPPELVSEVLARQELSTDPWTLAAVQICGSYPGLTDVATAADVDATSTAVAIGHAALAQFQLVGDRWGSLLALNELAELAACSKQFKRSAELISQALPLADELGLDEEAASLLCSRGDLRLWMREPQAAGDDYSQALVRAKRAGSPYISAAARIGLARSARYGGDLAKAQELALVALSRCPEDWDEADLAMTEVLAELAAIAAAAGRPEEAHSWRLKAGLVSEQYRSAGR
jgi:tetratricopeptide (TPR) repeat protein